MCTPSPSGMLPATDSSSSAGSTATRVRTMRLTRELPRARVAVEDVLHGSRIRPRRLGAGVRADHEVDLGVVSRVGPVGRVACTDPEDEIAAVVALTGRRHGEHRDVRPEELDERLAAVARAEADVHVDVVAGLQLREAAMDVVELDRDAALDAG